MSISFTVFSKSTGAVIRTGCCSEQDFDLQSGPDEVVCDGGIDPSKYYLKDGAPTQYSEEQLSARGNRPNIYSHWSNITMVWEDGRDFDEIKRQGLNTVDDLAGAARLRYITSVPGQAETYAKKEQQARVWAAESFAGYAPSFIAAEAQALGVSAQSVALEVIALADFWSNIKGPQIEATRRKWKVAIDSASDPSLIPGLVVSARAELDAL